VASILRVTTQWSGFTGAPGWTVTHWGAGGGTLTEACDAATSAMRTFWDSLKTNFPTGITFQVLQEVPMLDVASGSLQDVLSATSTPAAVTGLGSGVTAAPAGASVIWGTGTVRNGRRLRGRTYLVPLASTQYEANGSLTASAITSIGNAAQTLRSTVASPLMVFGRPDADVPGLETGVAANVVSHSIRDLVAVLRSRRD